MQEIIIDRIEGSMAVVELPDGSSTAVPLCLFLSAKEGDVYRITKEDDRADEREKKIKSKFESLKKPD